MTRRESKFDYTQGNYKYSYPDFSKMQNYNDVKASYNATSTDIKNKMTSDIQSKVNTLGTEDLVNLSLVWTQVLCGLYNNYFKWCIEHKQIPT